MNRITNFANRRTSGNGFAFPSFWLPLNDAGSGAVNTTPGIGVGAPTFTRATTATTIRSSGLLTSVGTGVARASYSPAGIYLGYLSEEARTNLVIMSSNYSDASWTKNAVTMGGAVTLPDGTGGIVNKIQETAATSAFFVAQAVAKAASALVYTWSVWVKASERGFAYLQLSDGGVNNASASWNLTTGAIVSAATVAGNFTGASASAAVAYPNGWFRLILTATSNTVAAVVGAVCPSVTGSDSFTYTGTANSGVYAWGAQLEQASFPTSYIPTVGAAATRNQDQLTYPGAGNVIASAGTLYAETTLSLGDTGTLNVASVSDGSLNNRVTIFNSAPGSTVGYRVVSGGVAQLSNVGVNNYPAANTIAKQAIRWSATDAAAFLNGLADRSTGAGITPPASLTQINVGVGDTGTGSQPNGTIKNLRLMRAFPDQLMTGLTS